MALQKFLNGSAATMVAASGAGSPGNETSTFGPATKAAVIKFQTANGVSPAAGYVGAITRAKIASVCGGSTSTTPTPTGPGLSVSAAAQPANSLAPQGASRIPFTTFTLTNNTGAAVTVNNVTVQRTGFGVDANFSGIVLLDQNGLQVGTAKTLNSNHQANVGDAWTLNAGQSMTLTVAGNIATGQTTSGQIVSLQVVAINTSAPVSGSLPINGASHTINTTLSLGSVSTTTSSFDPGTAQTKNIGDTNVRISGIRFTAGSAEDLKLFNIRWRQVGTASASDISNVMVDVNGTKYPATVDSTGKYYTVLFPGGLMITKGNSIDAYISADMTGSGSASRTVRFDIDKVTDVYFVGQLYGYGVAPSGTYTPWFAGYTTTINAGSATTIGKANEVVAQNVAVSVSNQPLGGFVTDFKGEAVSVTQLVFQFNYSSGAASSNLLTNVSIVDENGVVVSGPKDGVATGGTEQAVTFTDTVTFPTGRHVYTLKGKIPSTVSNNVTIIGSTTPSGWSSPVGQTSGNSITISQGNFSMNTMTVRAATLNVSMSTTPASQSIVAGSQGLTFANVQLDAGQSGEDVRISAIPVRLTVASGAAVGDLSSCAVMNGTTQLNTGSNVPSSLASSGSANTFTFDNSLTITKGTTITLTLKCNVSSASASSGTYIWSVNSSDTWNSTGITSGNSITETVTTGNAGTMTVGTASLAVTLDPSSPAYAIANAGATGVTLGAYKLTASNDAVSVNRVGLSLGAITASSTPADVPLVTLWVNGVQVGTASFNGAARNATSTLSTPITVPKDGSVVLVVKGTLGAQGASEAGHPGALLTVDIDVNTNTQGTGVGSGTTINATGSTAVAGVRVFRSNPIVAKMTTGMSSTLIAQSGIDLYRFSVTASPSTAQGIALNEITVNIATSSISVANGSTTVTNLKVYAFTDSSFSQAVAGFTAGQVVATLTGVNSGDNVAALSSILTIPAGQTYYFKVIGDITQVAGTTGSAGSVTTKITGDSTYPSIAALMGQYATGDGAFIWSPLSTTSTAATGNIDWTNGFQVPGLPSAGLDAFTLSK